MINIIRNIVLNLRMKNKGSISIDRYEYRSIFYYIVFSIFSMFLFIIPTNLYSYSIDSQKILSSRISFWEDVFYKYPSSSILIHDMRYPELILDIIDYKKLSKMNGRKYSKYERSLILQKYFKRYELAVLRFKQVGVRAKTIGKIEDRVYKVYSKNKDAFRLLLEGKVLLRTQMGFSGEFLNALKRSNNYMGKMEKIFKSLGVPKELTRLAFVESMFNDKAQSSVGAKGIWQIMPTTAREHMIVNYNIDERKSIYKASKVAAKILRQNYNSLKSWPLAVTAYNHGVGGMKQAIRFSGSNKLGDIIKSYYGKKNFGFASSNFYAEFVAASRVYDRYKNRIYVNNYEDVIGVRTKKSVKLLSLIKALNMDVKTFSKLNPCIKENSFRSNFYLPKGFEIYIPKNKETRLSYVDLKKINIY